MKLIWILLFPVVCFSANFTLFTIPKSGTHLVIKLLESPLFCDAARDSSPYHEHFRGIDPVRYFHKKGPAQKAIVPIRDIRDVALSWIDWVEKYPEHCPIINRDAFFSMSKEDKIIAMFSPEIWGKSLFMEEYKACMRFIKAVPSDRLLLISFEKLLGSKGGGSDYEQLEEIRRVADFLSIPYNEQQLQETAENLWGSTVTFNKGQSERWKSEYNASHIELSQAVCGEYLMKFGYEIVR